MEKHWKAYLSSKSSLLIPLKDHGVNYISVYLIVPVENYPDSRLYVPLQENIYFLEIGSWLCLVSLRRNSQKRNPSERQKLQDVEGQQRNQRRQKLSPGFVPRMLRRHKMQRRMPQRTLKWSHTVKTIIIVLKTNYENS